MISMFIISLDFLPLALTSVDGTPKTELNPKTNVTAFATKFVLTLSKLLNNNVTNN